MILSCDKPFFMDFIGEFKEVVIILKINKIMPNSNKTTSKFIKKKSFLQLLIAKIRVLKFRLGGCCRFDVDITLFFEFSL